MTTDLDLFNAGLETNRRSVGGGAVGPLLIQSASLTRTRSYGSASTLVHAIQQAQSLLRGRVLGGQVGTWTSGTYMRSDTNTTPLLLNDVGNPSIFAAKVTNTGAATFTGGITAASIDIPSMGGTGFHVDNSGDVGTGGTNATDAASPFLLTAAGALSARTVNIYPKDSTSKALVVTNDKGTSANLTEWNDGSGVATRVSPTGAFGSARSLSLYNALTDTQPTVTMTSSSPGELQLGTGGSTALDVFLRRIAAKVLQLGGALNASGNAIELNSMTAPAVASSTEGLRIYDEAGILKWKNHAGTVYDLSAFSTTTLATDTLWDALGDLVYGSGADTAAKLTGNTTTAQKFLTQTGTGTVSAAPSWFDLFGTANTFTVSPQTIGINNAGNKGLVINLAASQTARAIEVNDSSGVQAFALAGSGADVLITQYAATPQITGRRAEGTNTSPTAVAADSVGLGLGFRGYGTSFATQDKANIQLTAAETWSASAQGTYIAFLTTKNTTTTRSEVARFTNDGAMEMPEVTTPAAARTNAARLYVDDNGAGKSRLMVIFNTGAAQVIAIQP